MDKPNWYNKLEYLSRMLAWYYFTKPTHLAYHDLRSEHNVKCVLPRNITSLLGLGLKFCPTPRYTFSRTDIDTTLSRHRRDLWLRHYFKTQASAATLDPNANLRLYVKSKWIPPPWKIHNELKRRFDVFSKCYTNLFQYKTGQSNLLPHHRSGLQTLQSSKELLICACDKNLGPAIIEISSYIKLAYKDHLDDENTYTYLSNNDVRLFAERIRNLLSTWSRKWHNKLLPSERKFIKTAINDPKADPIATFYLTMKVHKTPLQSRPIVSCSGTILYNLGIWVDDKLQRIAKKQHSYFKSSTDLKKIMMEVVIPPNATLFTSDAVSMYTNIDTNKAMNVIARYLKDSSELYSDVPIEALLDALNIVMRNNVFRFGDTHWHQISGTAMGTPPAPPYATLYYAIHETIFLEEFKANLLFYRRFIDDIIGIWVVVDEQTDAQTWICFKNRLNNFGLVRETNDRSSSVVYMDLTIKLANQKLSTSLYEKALNLYLYIPPHSAHPPGVLTGLIYGNMHRIYTLCSDPTDQRRLTQLFYRRLIARGYKPQDILPLFRKAESRFTALTSNVITDDTTTESPDADRVFLHLPYHPGNPKSHQIQSLWREQLLQPQYKRHLSVFTDSKRLTVAYSRPRNLSNLLSSRLIKTHDGPPVLSYRIRITNIAGATERSRERQRDRETERQRDRERERETDSCRAYSSSPS